MIGYLNMGLGPEDAVTRNPLKQYTSEFGDPSAFTYGALKQHDDRLRAGLIFWPRPDADRVPRVTIVLCTFYCGSADTETRGPTRLRCRRSVAGIATKHCRTAAYFEPLGLPVSKKSKEEGTQHAYHARRRPDRGAFALVLGIRTETHRRGSGGGEGRGVARRHRPRVADAFAAAQALGPRRRGQGDL